MHNENRYKICVVEEYYDRPNGSNDSWYHCFLALVQVTDSPNKHTQQLHFMGGTGEDMVPVVYSETQHDEWFDERDVFPLMEGTESEVLPYWNYGLKAARYIGEEGFHFEEGYRHSPKSRNCRTAVKAIMRLMGLGMSHEFTVSVAGTQADGFPSEPVFYPQGQAVMPLDGLRVINNRLVMAMRDPELAVSDHPFARRM